VLVPIPAERATERRWGRLTFRLIVSESSRATTTDRLRLYLHPALQSRFRISSDKAAAVLSELPIVHVHGILGSYPEVPYVATSDPEELLAISRRIQIIHEIERRERGVLQ
jgi:hypothetical protein